jgi:hypothetical protein
MNRINRLRGEKNMMLFFKTPFLSLFSQGQQASAEYNKIFSD